MKKLIALLTVMATGIFAAFAYQNIITLGIKGAVPTTISTAEIDGSETPSFLLNSTGLNLGYIGTFDSGFSFKINSNIGLGAGHSSVSALDIYEERGMLNLGLTDMIGAGYNFVNTGNCFLGVYGNLGTNIDIAFGGKEEGDYVYATVLVSPAFLVGADITFVYTPGKVFSFFGSISANAAWTMIPVVTTKVSKDGNESEVIYEHYFSSSKPYLAIIPTIGISWRF